MGSGQDSADEVDHHQLEEDRFAFATAELLKQRALRGEYENLIIIAAPKLLGVLRKYYHKEVKNKIVAEVAKDLTRHQKIGSRPL